MTRPEKTHFLSYNPQPGTQKPLRSAQTNGSQGLLTNAEPVGFEPTVPSSRDFTLAG